MEYSVCDVNFFIMLLIVLLYMWFIYSLYNLFGICIFSDNNSVNFSNNKIK